MPDCAAVTVSNKVACLLLQAVSTNKDRQKINGYNCLIKKWVTKRLQPGAAHRFKIKEGFVNEYKASGKIMHLSVNNLDSVPMLN